MTDRDHQTTVELMGEVQQDERAFAVLTARLFKEGRHRYVTYGDLLREYGDPRSWPEYQQ